MLPTYSQMQSIAECIRCFEALEEVNQVIVLNHSAAAGTSEQVAATGDTEIVETTQGYGAAIKTDCARPTLISSWSASPMGPSNPNDLRKLLAFMPECECEFVIGSRTVSNYIWSGANMGRFLQWRNWFVAKLIEALYNTSYLSEVGYRFWVVTSVQAQHILARSRLDGSVYGLEMLIISVIIHTCMVHVPVNCHPRVGFSSVTVDLGSRSPWVWR